MTAAAMRRTGPIFLAYQMNSSTKQAQAAPCDDDKGVGRSVGLGVCLDALNQSNIRSTHTHLITSHSLSQSISQSVSRSINRVHHSLQEPSGCSWGGC